ncbi:MAG: DUF1566 domain-containing protein [Nitrospirae bacterium]|nr:DUF1566 domain-containing protein [Nitrospirota bacterium]
MLNKISFFMVLTLFLCSESYALATAQLWATGQTTGYYANDDGTLKRGVQWPSPRFTSKDDGTVTDNLTGLVWLRNANCFDNKIWFDALNYANNLASGQCGLMDRSKKGDWRLPNRKELRSLIDYSQNTPALPEIHPFTNVQSDNYWTSTTNSDVPAGAWVVSMADGDVNPVNKAGDGSIKTYIWPVRFPTPPPTFDKAIIVAGGGPFSGNTIWDSTVATANNAYKALIKQDFTKNTIKYLSAETGNQNVTDPATSDNLKKILETWAADNTNDLVIYFTDHGFPGQFKMGETDFLQAETFNNWLNVLQAKITGSIIFVYDACNSESFIPYLKPPEGKQRIIISSAKSSQNASFMAQGLVSFSYFFWNQVYDGAKIYDAFVFAKNATWVMMTDKDGKRYQEPCIDDNGNGISNEKNDGDLARTKVIGSGTGTGAPPPSIKSVSAYPPLLNDRSSSAMIKVDDVGIVSVNEVLRVWATIFSPDYTGSADIPVTDLPSVELTYVSADKSWEGTYDNFKAIGNYIVSVYLMDKEGNISYPVSTTVTQMIDLVQKPKPAIKVNGIDADSVELTTSDMLNLTISLDSRDFSGKKADWWLYAYTPYGTFYFDLSTGWTRGYKVSYTGELFNFPPALALTLPLNGLQSGYYQFIFEVDANPDGIRNGNIYTSSVVVNVK